MTAGAGDAPAAIGVSLRASMPAGGHVALGRRKDVHGLAIRRGVARHGRALVPRAAAAAVRRVRVGAAGIRGPGRRAIPVLAGPDRARGLPSAASGEAGRPTTTAHHAHDPRSRTRRRLGHHAPDRGTPLGRRPERRAAPGGSSEPVVPAQLPAARGARAGRSPAQRVGHGHRTRSSRVPRSSARSNGTTLHRSGSPTRADSPTARSFPSRDTTGSPGTRSRTASRTCPGGSTATSGRSGRSSRCSPPTERRIRARSEW